MGDWGREEGMKEPGTKATTKEFIKSVMMVVLVLSTILLLYVFWEDINPGQMTLGELTEQESVHLRQSQSQSSLRSSP